MAIPAMHEEINRKLKWAKITLMEKPNTTFFSVLLANLILALDENLPTAATNGKWIKLNPNFVEKQSQGKLLGLLLHEVLHVALEHVTRCLEHNLDHKLLNMAGDYYINLFLVNKGFEIPEGGLLDKKYQGMSTMQIYDDLLANPPPAPQQEAFQMDISTDVPEGKTADDLSQEILDIVLKAATQAQMADDYGSVPADIQRKIEEITNPKLPWNVILMNFMSEYMKDDFSMRRPNRRYMPDYYLPTLYSEAMGEMVSGTDVSISMTDEQLKNWHGELRAIWNMLQPKKLKSMSFDTRVHENETYHIGDYIPEFVMKGGGGTNVGPLIQYLRENSPELCLIFTDGHFSTPDMSGLKTNIFWIITGNKNFRAPQGVGRVIYYD